MMLLINQVAQNLLSPNRPLSSLYSMIKSNTLKGIHTTVYACHKITRKTLENVEKGLWQPATTVQTDLHVSPPNYRPATHALMNAGQPMITCKQHNKSLIFCRFVYLWIKRRRLKPELLYAGKHGVARSSQTARRLRVGGDVSGEFFLGYHICIIWWRWNRNAVRVGKSMQNY